METRIRRRVLTDKVDPFLFPIDKDPKALNQIEYDYVSDQKETVVRFREVDSESEIYKQDPSAFFDELFDDSREGNINCMTTAAQKTLRGSYTPPKIITVGEPKSGSKKSVYLGFSHTKLLVQKVLPKYNIFVNLKVVTIHEDTARYAYNDNYGFDYSGEGFDDSEILDVPLRYESVKSVGHWTPLEPLRCHTFHEPAYCAVLEQSILEAFQEAEQHDQAQAAATTSPKKKMKTNY
jgi:hypothetical protein